MVRCRLLLPALLLLLGGCATAPVDERDPLEGFNRAVYRFNDAFDRAILTPVAKGYQAVVPDPVDRGITNFFSNLDDFVVLFNDILQLKGRQALSDAGRILVNSTIGLVGFFDVATGWGMPKHNEDLGQTLGYWGVGSGPYLVLPFLGPSTLRDGTAMVGDWQVDPLYRVEDDATMWGAVAVESVDTRADLLHASRVLEEAALDPYIFMRDAYLQRRENLVYDGNPPMPEFDEEFEFEEEPFEEPLPEEPAAEAPPAEAHQEPAE